MNKKQQRNYKLLCDIRALKKGQKYNNEELVELKNNIKKYFNSHAIKYYQK